MNECPIQQFHTLTFKTDSKLKLLKTSAKREKHVSNEPGGVVHAVVAFDGALQSFLLEGAVKHARTVIS